ncbi:nucleolar protein 3 [Trichosurus vulpecula]|uniref:nucleolar protein 3 n=1 Tax=Trichosurus vulpecula TaxID=9337 RepID=UPI00186B5261|nr:nucleolar protein 3 [Trichosurus vulpecula]XP_036606733.1 nucleolar protein 3 [Trichosurus vulpecula]
MGNIQDRPSEMIQRERKQLVEVLKNDSVILLDGLMARGIITVSEYESLDAMNDPEHVVRRILLIVQKKGEFACQELLKCASEIHPYDSRDPYWNWKLTPEGYSHHHHRSHDSCCTNDQRKISCGGTCIGVPNPADEDKTGDMERSQDSEAAELDTLEDQESSKDPEPESQSPEEDESANEVLEEPEPQSPGNNDLSEWYVEPEPEHGEVVEDEGEGADAEEDF